MSELKAVDFILFYFFHIFILISIGLRIRISMIITNELLTGCDA